MADDKPLDSKQALEAAVRLESLANKFSALNEEVEQLGNKSITMIIDQTEKTDQLNAQLNKVLRNREKIVSTLNAEIETLEKEAATSSTIQKKQEAQRKLIEKQLELEKEKSRQHSDQKDELEKINKTQEKLNKKVKENVKQQENVTEELKKQTEETEQLKSNLNAIDNSFSSALGSVKRIASGDIVGGLKGVAGNMFDITRVIAKSKQGEGGFLSKILDPVGSIAKSQMEKLSKSQKGRLAEISDGANSFASSMAKAGNNTEAAATSFGSLGTSAAAAVPAVEATAAATASTGQAAAAAVPVVAEAGAATAAMGSSAAAAGVSVAGLTAVTGGLILVVIALIAILAVAVGSFVLLAKEIISFNIQLYDANKLIQRTTYLSKENSKALFDNASDMRAMGVTTEDMVAATQALVSGFKDFTKQTPENQKALVEFTSLMNRLGMSAQATATSLTMMTKAMGYDIPQATQQIREIEYLARDLQVPFSELGQSLGDNIGYISKFGKEGTRVFKDLAAASKNSQIEIGRLVAIVRQFDTFESASSTAGKLNAALGGNFLNAMEMITTTDPVQRLKMIQQAILSTGVAFDEMGYYQQEMLAASAGLQDVSELALVMSGNFDLAAGSVKKTSDEYITAEERARDLQGFMEALKNTFYSVLPEMKEALPVFEEIIKKFATSLQDPKTQQGIKDFANELFELAPLALEIAQSFGTLLKLMIAFADVGAFVLSPFIKAAEAALGLFNSLFGDGSITDIPGYAIELNTTQFNPAALLGQATGEAIFEAATSGTQTAPFAASSPALTPTQAQDNVNAVRKALTDARTAGNSDEEIRLLKELIETLRAKEMSVNVTSTNGVATAVEAGTSNQ